MASENLVRWMCVVCSVFGTVPLLHDTNVRAVRDRIARSHEENAPGCHMIRGIERVQALTGIREFDLYSDIEREKRVPVLLDDLKAGAVDGEQLETTATTSTLGVGMKPGDTQVEGTTGQGFAGGHTKIGDASADPNDKHTGYAGDRELARNSEVEGVHPDKRWLTPNPNLGDEQRLLAQEFADVGETVFGLKPSSQREGAIQHLIIAKDYAVRASML